MAKLFSFLSLFFICSCYNKNLPQDTLFIAIDSEIKSLDPRKATDANSMRLVGLLFNGLVKVGSQLEVLPDGATKWEQKGLSYVFYLKPLVFSNQRPVTAKDIEFSFQEFTKKSSPFFGAFKNIKSIQVSKKNKNFIVKITLKKFSATFLASDLPVIKILPQKEITQNKKQFLKTPIGTGPFKLVHHHSKSVLLERIHPQPSYPQFFNFSIIKDSFTRTQKVLTEQIDIAPSVIPKDKIYRFKNDKFRILSQPSLSTTYLLLNLKNQILSQKKARKALALSLNRDEIIKYKLKGYGVIAHSLIQPKNIFFNSDTPVFSHNLNQAQQLIESLHLKNKALTLTTTNNQDSLSKAKVLSSQMNQAGLKVKLESYEWGTFYNDLNQGRYEMALMKWVGITDPDIYRVAFHSQNQAPAGRNRSFYNQIKLDKLLEKGLILKDSQSRKQIYDEVQKHIAQNYLIIPLWHDMEVSIVRSKIKNYSLPLNGDFSSLIKVQK